MDVRYLAVHLRPRGAFAGTLSRAAVGGREEEEEKERQGGRFGKRSKREKLKEEKTNRV